MKLFFKIFVFSIGISCFSAQERDTISLIKTNHISNNTTLDTVENIKIEKPVFGRKGTMFVFWGWNRAWFTKSDIHFKGANYNFYLNNVVAHDRPSKLSWDYINPAEVSTPQFNFRLAYFIKDNLALVIAQDHMKYVMDQNQTVDFKGNISDPIYAAMVQNQQVDLRDEQFLTFEHTDGLNYINLGLEKYKVLSNKNNFQIAWSYGGGLGVMFPKSNVKLFGNERSDRFHIAGFGADARTNINFLFWKHWIARVEAKFGYINMPDVKTTLNNKPDKASHDFIFGQVNFGIGYLFQTKKQN